MAKAAKKSDATEDGRKVIAVHEIMRCIKPGERGNAKMGVDPVKPKTQTLTVGTVFLASEEENENGVSEYDFLISQGAVRDYTKKDEADVRRMTQVVGNTDDEEAAAAASSSEGTSGSVKTSSNAGTTTTGTKAAGGEGSNLI